MNYRSQYRERLPERRAYLYRRDRVTPVSGDPDQSLIKALQPQASWARPPLVRAFDASGFRFIAVTILIGVDPGGQRRCHGQSRGPPRCSQLLQAFRFRPRPTRPRSSPALRSDLCPDLWAAGNPGCSGSLGQNHPWAAFRLTLRHDAQEL